MTGSGYQTAYQFAGMENDAWAYYKPGRYYSPLMGRPLSSTGPLTAPGGYDSGLAGVVSASMPGSGGGSGCDPVNLSAFQVGAETFAAAEAFDLIVPVLTYGEINPGTALPAAVVAAIAETVFEVLDLFGVFGGGHPYIPPLIRFELGHQGGSPQALGGLIGMDQQLAPDQRPVGEIQKVQEVVPVPEEDVVPLPEEGPEPEPLAPNFFNPRQATPKRCLTAAKGDVGTWTRFCGSLPSRAQRGRCREHNFSIPQERMNWCVWEFDNNVT